MSQALQWITPAWSAPSQVVALTTTRLGGVSVTPFDSLNLGNHVDDSPACVASNRSLLNETLELPSEPAWLQQVHGTEIIPFASYQTDVTADGCYSDVPGQVCAIMTADCLPILITDSEGTQVMALHAGWRGLAAGIIEAGCLKFAAGAKVIAWLGPAIRQAAFEVGDEVRATFIAAQPQAEHAFKPSSASGKWLCDLALLATQRLQAAGATEITDCGLCTYADNERFYSYRRDGQTGRMATLIWRKK